MTTKELIIWINKAEVYHEDNKMENTCIAMQIVLNHTRPADAKDWEFLMAYWLICNYWNNVQVTLEEIIKEESKT